MVCCRIDPSSESACARQPLVSVVMPVLNGSSSRLSRAIASVLDQTYRRVELVIVDDGSEPGIAALLDEVAAAQERVRVLHQPNRGVSRARNRGLDLVGGTYVGFLDADDSLPPDFVEAAVGLAEHYRLDVVFGAMEIRNVHGDSRWRAPRFGGAGFDVLDSERIAALRAAALSSSPDPARDVPVGTATNVVGALYRASLLDQVRFVPGVAHGEDRLFNVDVLARSQRVGFSSSVWYVYDRTAQSGVTQRLGVATALALATTMDAFAGAGGLVRVAGPAGDTAVRDAAARGVLNYLKAALRILATDGQVGNRRIVAELVALGSVRAAAATARGLAPADRAIALLVRLRATSLLYALAVLRSRRVA